MRQQPQDKGHHEQVQPRQDAAAAPALSWRVGRVWRGWGGTPCMGWWQLREPLSLGWQPGM